MAKNIEQQLEAAQKRKVSLIAEREEISAAIKKAETDIKSLESRRKKEMEAEAIKRISASGFSVEDILDLLGAQVKSRPKEER